MRLGPRLESIYFKAKYGTTGNTMSRQHEEKPSQ